MYSELLNGILCIIAKKISKRPRHGIEAFLVLIQSNIGQKMKFWILDILAKK